MRAVGTVTDDFPIWTQRRHTMRATFSRSAGLCGSNVHAQPCDQRPQSPPLQHRPHSATNRACQSFIVDSPLLIVLLDLRMVS